MTGTSALVQTVRGRLRANGDWNVNDWKDAARVLADALEKAERENEDLRGGAARWEK